MQPEENKKSFIEELQSLEEPIKRRVFIVAIVVVVLAVTYIWFGYFNGLVSSAAPTQSPVATQQTSSGTNFLADIGNGFMNAIHWVAGIFQGPGQYNIQPTH